VATHRDPGERRLAFFAGLAYKTAADFGLTLAPIDDNNEEKAMATTTWSGAALGALALALAAIAPAAQAQYGAMVR
jgi:hypothetical protein